MKNRNKPKIAIVIDKKGWALENAAEQIKINLYKYYEIDIISMEDFEDNAINLLLYVSGYDLIFFMWRGIISWVYSDYSKKIIAKLGFEYEDFLNKYLREKNIITAVYDHLFLQTEKERTEFILDNVKTYAVCSKKLKEIYNVFEKKPSFIVSDGVDLEIFKMLNKAKYNDIENKTVKIGWTGNSKFTDEEDDDLKGLNHIIKPAIQELKEEGYKVDLEIADRNVKMIPHNQMPNYYNKIDIYICASRTEGHPATILEAMACGVPIISTDVGIVSDVFGKNQRKFITKRDMKELKEKIIELITNKKMLKKISDENLVQIRKWSWKKMAKNYKKFFDDSLRLK